LERGVRIKIRINPKFKIKLMIWTEIFFRL